MQRIVTAELDLDLSGSIDLIFSITASQQMPVVTETISFEQGDRVYTPTELVDQSGTRLHRLQAEQGRLEVRYEALVEGQGGQSRTSELDSVIYLRPSRYCQSDEVFTQARRQFAGLDGVDLIHAVTRFVEKTVTYTPGLSMGTDSAVTTLMTGQGVCRDYAHVVISLLRAMDVPARYAACYAPGLVPMDFHAVAEAYLDGSWYVIDATRLAPRDSLVRIATGRDAADCAFLSYHGGNVLLSRMRVDATLVEPFDGADAGATASDDFTRLVQLA